MARRTTRQVNQRYVSGNLAYDYDYLERERRRREEREQWEYAERRMREKSPAAPRRFAEQPKKKRRERIRVSNSVVIGFAVAAVMIVSLIMSYAQLAIISQEVVREQKRIATLQEERVKLLARYERTFDLTTIREAAEDSGMAKPSASQIYYVDLSAPDNVVLYERTDGNALSHVFAAVGQNVETFVEYFK